MKEGITVVCVTLITLFCFEAFSLPSPGDSACRLNLTEYPYKPLGGCTNIHEKLENWNGFPLTSCCQNALLVLAHALALRSSHDSSGTIFMPPDQWADCSGPFRLQPNVSIQTCGFQDFVYGEGGCSMIKLESIDKNVVDHCSSFGFSSFDDACGSCTSAISKEASRLSADLGENGVEEAVCGVAVVVSVIAGTANRTADDLMRCLPALATPTDSKNYIVLKNNAVEAPVAVILLIVVLTAIFVLIKHVSKKIKKEGKKEVVTKEIATQCTGLYRFSKTEIEKAINFANEKEFLGRGSAGRVYKGRLPSGQFVAIKQLYQGSMSDSFAREIDGLSRVRHPNLVCLFGCCIADGQHYLVYEYCPYGNLSHHLLKKVLFPENLKETAIFSTYGPCELPKWSCPKASVFMAFQVIKQGQHHTRSDCVLPWKLRVKILRDCAAAIKYLHQHISGCIVHRDIKLTNVLLGHDMEPKLSDFGLSKMLGFDESKVFTEVRGTIGYLDPEYMTNAKLTCASDIYSFGIVALQLLSGQRVIELDLEARDQLTRKAKDVSMGRRPLSHFQDVRMKGDVINNIDFESVLQLAVLCTAGSSKGRPTIDLVFDELERVWQNTQDSEEGQVFIIDAIDIS